MSYGAVLTAVFGYPQPHTDCVQLYNWDGSAWSWQHQAVAAHDSWYLGTESTTDSI